MSRKFKKIIWITWEKQRRTDELSAALSVPLLRYDSSYQYLIRIVFLTAKTVLKLLTLQPQILIVQNPSLVLTAVACFIKPIVGFRIVVDRHSNFKFDTIGMPSLKYIIFHILSKYTVKRADLTIITNDFLKELVEEWGGRAFVLPDKLPELSFAKKERLVGEKNVAYICTYSSDEPLEDVINGARLFDKSIVFHITGDYRNANKGILGSAPVNVSFTGFLSEEDYQSLLFSCDIVMVLTKQDHTLLCGAYEGVALGKPLILSNKQALRAYFNKGVVFTENNSKSIAIAVRTCVDSQATMRSEMTTLRSELEENWHVQFAQLKKLIESL